jgi:hypothetical protein
MDFDAKIKELMELYPELMKKMIDLAEESGVDPAKILDLAAASAMINSSVENEKE